MARMNLPIAVLCGECKFWHSEDVLDSYRDTYEESGWDDSTPEPDPTVGICVLAKHAKQVAASNPYHLEGGFQGPMAMKDGSNYLATLWTKVTHGCLAGVQKESSENVQSPTAA